MLTKEKCLFALESFKPANIYEFEAKGYLPFTEANSILTQLINEHFEIVKEYETYKKINRFEKECEKFYCKENYFNIIIKALCDCKDKELQDNAIHCLAYLKQQLDNPPLKFEELKENMWVWDNKNKLYVQIEEDFDENDIIFLRYYEDSYNSNCERTLFKENRFYRKEVNNDE